MVRAVVSFFFGLCLGGPIGNVFFFLMGGPIGKSILGCQSTQ